MKEIDTPQFRQFILDHVNDNPAQLRLKYHNVATDGLDYTLAITQIEARRKHAGKFRNTLASTPGFLFPDALAAEQATGDALAAVHAGIVSLKQDDTVVDLTAGLGIDALHMAPKAGKVVAVEIDSQRAKTLRHNAEAMGLDNLTVVCGDCIDLVNSGELSGDVAFIDPARRTDDNRRIFAVAECKPNVIAMLPELRRHFRKLVVKLSPMLDISQTLNELGAEVSDIYAIGTRTECKEVVAVLEFDKHTDNPVIHALSIVDGDIYDFGFTAQQEANAAAPSPRKPVAELYAYEPWPAVQKAAPLKLFADRHHMYKAANNTHVYFSDELIRDIQANAYRIAAVIPWQSKYIKRLKKEYPALDITVRNFGMSADALRAKLGVRPADTPRLLGLTDAGGERQMLILDKA